MEKARELHAVHRGRSLIAVAILLSIASIAQAQGDSAAKQEAAALLNEGNKLFDAKQFEGALRKYQEAYAAYSSPKILLNVAEAHLQLGNNELSARAYERFLSETPEGTAEKQRKLAADRLATLTPKLGHIAVESSIDPVTVWIDGEEKGRTPLAPIRVEPGRREIRAEQEGYESVVKQALVRAGKTENVRFEMTRIEPVIALAPPVTQETTPEIAAPAVAIESPPTTVHAPVESEPITSKWWVWALAGVVVAGGVAIGVAAATGGDDFVPAGELGRSSTADWQSLLIRR